MSYFSKIISTFGFLLLLIGCGNGDRFLAGEKGAQTNLNPGGNNKPLTQFKTFTAGYEQRQDFLLVIDNSDSMADEIDSVINNLRNFFASLQSQRKVDYQVGVTTTNAYYDRGRLYQSAWNRDVITASMVDPIAEISSILQKIKAGIGRDPYVGYESGLGAMDLALASYKSRFTRSDVPLAAVILSDEDDQACTFWPSTCTSSQLSQRIRSNFPRTSVYPIVAPANGCSGVYSSDRYLDFMRVFGSGKSFPICQGQIAHSLQKIAEEISNQGICYPLTAGTIDSSIQVKINGAPIVRSTSNGFYFNGGTACVHFVGSSTPREGDRIDVEFQ